MSKTLKLDELTAEKEKLEGDRAALVKNLEEYDILRKSLDTLKKSGPISEDTIVDYKIALKRLIGLEEKLIKVSEGFQSSS